MRDRAYVQTEEVAGGRRRTSAQPGSARPAPLQRLSPPHQAHPRPLASATRRTGAPHEGLLYAPLTARSRKHKGFEGEPGRKWRD